MGHSSGNSEISTLLNECDGTIIIYWPTYLTKKLLEEVSHSQNYIADYPVESKVAGYRANILYRNSWRKLIREDVRKTDPTHPFGCGCNKNGRSLLHAANVCGFCSNPVTVFTISSKYCSTLYRSDMKTKCILLRIIKKFNPESVTVDPRSGSIWKISHRTQRHHTASHSITQLTAERIGCELGDDRGESISKQSVSSQSLQLGLVCYVVVD